MSADATPKGALSVSMQRHVLAAILQSAQTFARCRAFLTPAHFSDEAASDIVALAFNLWDKHHEVPSRAALLDAFPDQESHVRVIKRSFKEVIADEKYTVERIATFARQRAMKKAILLASQIIKAAETGETLFDEDTRKPIKDDPIDLIRRASMVGHDAGNIGTFLHDAIDAIAHRVEHPKVSDYFTTGMEHLDASGVNVERGEIGCVLARAKGGKSFALLNIAFHNLIHGRNVVYYNLEIQEDRLEDRFGRRITMPKEEHKVNPQAYVARLRKRFPKLVKGKLLLKRFFANQTSIDDIRANLLQCHAQGFKPDLCIAEGSMVLTDAGTFPIERVPCNVRLWDGTTWVSHGGPVYKGVSDVIHYCGITATPDHKVWTDRGWRSLITCARLGLRVAKTGDGRRPLRIGEHYLSGGAHTSRQDKDPGVCPGAVRDVSIREVDKLSELATGAGEGVSGVCAGSASPFPCMATIPRIGAEAAVYEPQERRVGVVRGARDTLRLSEHPGGVCVDSGESGTSRGEGVGPDRQRRPLRSGESAVVDTRAELLAHPQEAEDAGTPRVQVGESGSALRGLDVVADDAQREDDADADRAAVEAWKVGRVAVWDIRNSGPFHRFTVQDVLVHNCIVDYAGLLKPAKVYDEMRFNLASLWLDFRGLCQEFNVAGWSAAQANRGGAAADLVTMTDIAESFAIVQHIDVGFSISRTPEEIEKNTGRFFVFASRNDKDGTIVNFEADFGRSLIKTTGLYDGASEPAKKGKDSTDQQSEEASFRDAQARMKKEKKEHHGDERQ